MYNQKCNEMSDSCHERLKKGLFIIITTPIVYKCSFASVKNHNSSHYSQIIQPKIKSSQNVQLLMFPMYF
ncbi:hypothetical protein D8X97_04870 [Listeria ivanovii]|nr:hypothetical protein [Listeria ivanovii]MBM5635931.1 hypothetical protein [Listeria ivanovii]MBM5705570.1 hypothetical protein [Listeria ivanovii]